MPPLLAVGPKMHYSGLYFDHIIFSVTTYELFAVCCEHRAGIARGSSCLVKH